MNSTYLTSRLDARSAREAPVVALPISGQTDFGVSVSVSNHFGSIPDKVLTEDRASREESALASHTTSLGVLGDKTPPRQASKIMVRRYTKGQRINTRSVRG